MGCAHCDHRVLIRGKQEGGKVGGEKERESRETGAAATGESAGSL